ncbi:YciI-like protein [Corynebacterium occultum]|uniref:YciI-like protein n=1 Tax=Corynebacterium occultum TaxID=2675219 RepID=A0A6B8VTX8_9CORY|nr:YciI family protein [Corynebacterium occultum]QGU07643.1 YciI-like protein [Corynebacterium occultum]
MNTFAILYEYVDDAEKVASFRAEHREFLGRLEDEGKLIGSGPFTDEKGGALIIIRLPEPATVEDAGTLFDKDPFKINDLITKRSIRAWNPVKNVFQEHQA